MPLNREAVVASAEKLVSRGKIEGAIKEYRKLVSENPSDAMTINRLGDLYVRINLNEEAVRLFVSIAERYTEDGFFVKAIAIFKKIIKLDPTRLPVYERLAELYHKQGLVTEARTQYQVLVDYYLKHGKIDTAETVLRKMTALDSGDPTPHVRLAEIFHDRGEHDKELQEYRLLAEMMLRHKRYDEAAQVYAKAIAAAPLDLGFITDAVLGLKDAGQAASAAKLLALAVEKNPQAEKIARIAGIGRDRKPSEATGVRTPAEDAPRPLKVSDVTSVPPELRAAVATRPEPRPETTRPEFRPEEIDVDLSMGEPGSAGEIQPTAEMLRRSPESPWFTSSESEVEFVLEIEGDEEATPEVAAPAPVTGSAPATDIDWSFEPEPVLKLDLDLLAPLPPLPPAPPSAARRHADLLAEAEVFRKHGLGEKAHDRVRTILHEEPRHADALALATQLYVDEGKFDRALTRAQQLQKLASETAHATEPWEATKARLERTGFHFESGAPVAIPEPKKVKKDSIAVLLDDLAGLATGKKAPAKKETPKRAAAAADTLSALVDELAATTKAKPTPVTKASPPAAIKSPEIVLPATPAHGAVPPVVSGDEEEQAIEDRLSWLDDAAARAAKPAAPGRERKAAADDLFEDEEGFFDLAAELEEELSKEELASKDALAREEPTLEEIVEGFKKGVAESLSAEDYDTHFNLGIAYREMGLLDEAIGEFQLAAKHDNYLLDCCVLLGSCFLDKGLPELGVKWYQRGLAIPNLKEEANLGLLYDLGNLYFATGDHDNARRAFIELYGINSNYRDVVAKLEELGSR